jgi:hypothetical protein
LSFSRLSVFQKILILFFRIQIGPQAKKQKSDSFGGKGLPTGNGLKAKSSKVADSDDDDDDDDNESVNNK